MCSWKFLKIDYYIGVQFVKELYLYGSKHRSASVRVWNSLMQLIMKIMIFVGCIWNVLWIKTVSDIRDNLKHFRGQKQLTEVALLSSFEHNTVTYNYYWLYYQSWLKPSTLQFLCTHCVDILGPVITFVISFISGKATQLLKLLETKSITRLFLQVRHLNQIATINSIFKVFYLWWLIVIIHLKVSKKVIKGTKVIAVIKRMLCRDKDQTWKTDIHNKEHK